MLHFTVEWHPSSTYRCSSMWNGAYYHFSFIHGNLFGSRGLYTWNAWWCRTLDIQHWEKFHRNICLTVIADIMHYKLNGQILIDTYCMIIIEQNSTYIFCAPPSSMASQKSHFFALCNLARVSKTTRFKISRSHAMLLIREHQRKCKKKSLGMEIYSTLFFILVNTLHTQLARSHGWLNTCSWRVSNCWRTLDTTTLSAI